MTARSPSTVRPNVGIRDLLSPTRIAVDVRASDKRALLRTLAERSAAALGIAPDLVLRALVKREELGSTGVGNGIAIPHARLDGVEVPFGMLVRLQRPIVFEAVDGLPV